MTQTQTRAATETVRLGFIGTGGIAATHASALDSLGDPACPASITAAYDPDRDAAERFTTPRDAKPFDSASDLIASGEVDALVVCAPPNIRLNVVEPAIATGLAVLVEKPLASTLAEAERLAALADAHPGRLAAVGYCHRFTPAVLKIRQMIAEGLIGRLTRFENCFAFHAPAMSGRWFSDPAVSGGGSFIDTGCHSLDLFQFLVGTPELVGIVRDNEWQGRGESSATALVRAAAGPNAGVAGTILAGWLEPTRFDGRLVGTEGSLFYDYMKPTEILHNASDDTTEVIEVETHEVRFARQLEAFVRGVAGGHAASEVGLASFADGLAVARAVDSIPN